MEEPQLKEPNWLVLHLGCLTGGTLTEGTQLVSFPIWGCLIGETSTEGTQLVGSPFGVPD